MGDHGVEERRAPAFSEAISGLLDAWSEMDQSLGGNERSSHNNSAASTRGPDMLRPAGTRPTSMQTTSSAHPPHLALLQRALDSLDRMGGHRFSEDFGDLESFSDSHANLTSIQTFGTDLEVSDGLRPVTPTLDVLWSAPHETEPNIAAATAFDSQPVHDDFTGVPLQDAELVPSLSPSSFSQRTPTLSPRRLESGLPPEVIEADVASLAPGSSSASDGGRSPPAMPPPLASAVVPSRSRDRFATAPGAVLSRAEYSGASAGACALAPAPLTPFQLEHTGGDNVGDYHALRRGIRFTTRPPKATGA